MKQNTFLAATNQKGLIIFNGAVLGVEADKMISISSILYTVDMNKTSYKVKH